MRRIFEPYAYGEGPLETCFWRSTTPPIETAPFEGPADCDFAVIGGGFTGLSAALRLAQAGADVRLLEANAIGWGASGRNGGFCCLGGSALSDDTVRKKYGDAAAQDYFDAERTAVDLVARRLEVHRLDVDRHSDGETMLVHTPGRLPELVSEAEKIKARYGLSSRVTAREELAALGMASPEFFGAVTHPIGFALNPAKYVTGLARVATGAGAQIHGNTTVKRLTPQGGGFHVRTSGGTLHARKVLVCTNGYSSEDLPDWLAGRYLPTQSNILVSRPLTDTELADQGWTSHQACYDSRNFVHYFRLMPDKRMLFGVRGTVRTSPEDMVTIRAIARADFDRFFPAWRSVETPHFWSGLVCLSRRLTPHVGEIPSMKGAYAALAFHGNGVAMGSLAGEMVADLALGRKDGWPVPQVMAAPLGRFPLGSWRRILLHVMWRLHRYQDQRAA